MSDEEIEKAILFYIIFQNEQFDLSEEDFTKIEHKKIINTINQLKLEKNEVSMLTVNNKINDTQMIKYLAYLGENITIETPQKLYEILKEYTKKRQVAKIAKNIMQEVIKIENADIFIEQTIRKLQKVEFQTQKEESFINQIIITSEIIENSINKQKDYSLYTGFFKLDDLMDGLHKGELTVIGARPGVGKTTFALQIAENIASKGNKVTFVSLEMSSVQMVQKLLALRTGINSRKIRNGDLSNIELEKIGLDCSKLSNLKFNLITKIHKIQQIEILARRLKNQENIDLLVIDYLQLVKNSGNFRNREQEVADISRTLKLLSLELNIPIIALCQLNRNATKTVPTLADIRESGAVEQDADNVILLYEEDSENYITTVDLQKQRSGNTGKTSLKFSKKNSQFINLDR